MHFITFVILPPLFLHLLVDCVWAGATYLPLVGSPCNPNNTRLLVDNNNLISDCGYVAWCDPANKICKVRGCRRDEWPFGFNRVERDIWPPLCRSDQFCPDEGSFCMDKVGLGRPCQLSRDDQCLQNAAPGGSRCLHNICVAVNATLGNTCTFENTIYTDFIDGNNNYGDIVSRDNCMAGLYCDSPSTTCREKLIKGGACSADKECRTGYCLDKSYLASVPVNNNVTGTCGEDEANAPPKAHVYALITIFSVLIAVGTLASLIYIHVRQTKAKKLAREEYWQEQRVISEKARQIDGSMRIKSSSFSSRHRLLPADSDISQSSSTSPSRRESRLHLVQRASDRSGSAPSSRFEGAISTTHPLQADYPSYLSVRQQEGGSSDNEYTNLPYTPTQEANEHAQASSSTHNLHDVYLGLSSAAMGAKIGSSSSAYDPFASSNEADRGIRSRETARHPTGDGWSSPDVRLNDETDWANEERRLLNVPKTGNPV